jgi:hypothetical protein
VDYTNIPAWFLFLEGVCVFAAIGHIGNVQAAYVPNEVIVTAGGYIDHLQSAQRLSEPKTGILLLQV